jgi:hypothetical protein
MNSIEYQKNELEALLSKYASERDPAQKAVLSQQAEDCFEHFRRLPGVSAEEVKWLQSRLERNLRAQTRHDSATFTTTPTPSASSGGLPRLGVVTPREATSSSPPVVSDPSDPEVAARAFAAIVEMIPQELPYANLEQIQEGRFGVGFRATESDTGDAVVIKLPAASGWPTRFVQCAEALRTEADMLDTVTAFLPDPDPRTCARVITQLDSSDLTVPDWPHPVPYSIQSFARGTRLWRSGLLPMRGDQERAGVLLLTQITGLVQCLYAHDLAHRDLKPDALFWDDTADLVEVIDWNSAKEPTADDIAREFNLSLTSLVCEVFLGVAEPTASPSGIGYSLFTEARGRGLSRGVRLLLARLLDPHFSSHAIRDLAGLHTALTELTDAWLDTEQTALPPLKATTPEALAARLTRAAIALLQPDARATPVERQTWYRQALAQAEQEVQKTLSLVLQYPAHLRAQWGKVADLALWLPDIWPLIWTLPLARAWFAHIPADRDAELTSILHPLLGRRWDALRAAITPLRPTVAADIQAHLDRLERLVTVQQQVSNVETLLKQTPPNYTEALRTLTPLLEALPLEVRLLELERQIMAGMQANAAVTRLQDEVAVCRAARPGLALQRRLLAALEQLQQAGYPDPETAEQHQLVALLDQAEQAYRAAQTARQDGDWPRVQQHLALWQAHAQLQAYAPDLDTALKNLLDEANWHIQNQPQIWCAGQQAASMKQAAQLPQQIEALLKEGDLDGALALATDPQTPRSLNTNTEQEELGRTLQAVHTWLHAQAQGQFTPGERLTLPSTITLPTVARLVNQADEIERQAGRMEPTANSEMLRDIWLRAQTGAEDQELPVLVRSDWQALRDQALDRLERQKTHDQTTLEARLAGISTKLEGMDTKLTNLEQKLVAAALAQSDSVTPISQDAISDETEKTGTTPIEPGPSTATATPPESPSVSTTMASNNREEQQDLRSTPDAITQDGQESTATPVYGKQRIAPKDPLSGTAADPTVLPPPDNPAHRSSPRGYRTPGKIKPRQQIIALLVGIVLILGIFVTIGIGIMNRNRSATTAPTPVASATPSAMPTEAAGNQDSETGAAPGVPGETAAPAEVLTPTLTSTLQVSPTDVITGVNRPITLSSSVDLRAIQAASLIIGAETIPLPAPQPGTIPNEFSVTLPLTLSTRLPQPVTLPMPNVKLDLGASMPPVILTLGNPGLIVTVQGADVNVRDAQEPTLINRGLAVEAGVYLWKELDTEKRGRNTDTVLPSLPTSTPAEGETEAVLTETPPPEPAEFVLLNNGDQVEILEVKDDHYLIKVVTNNADSDSPTVVGKQGWVLRTIVDGPAQ